MMGPRSCCALVLACGVVTTSTSAQDHVVDINALIDETQWMSEAPDEMTMIWWMPTEFWRLSFDEEPSMTEEERQELLTLLAPYHVVLAADGHVGVLGGVTYENEAAVRDNLAVVDNVGDRRTPIPVEELPADLQNLLSIMKPVITGMLGPMGESMHFFVFDATDATGETFGDTLSEGVFAVELGDRSASWRLPLSSLLPPKVCPVDRERMNGAWKYCPWHGVELVGLSG